jgi:hypothetical protein
MVLEPREIVSLVGVAERVKPAVTPAVTTNVTFAVCVNAPLVAVIVSG